MADYVTADPHFGHANIIRYCSRPFSSAEEMDTEIVRSWNSVVKATDKVFLLGDFAFTRGGGDVARAYAAEKINQLNGIKVLVMGNHDKRFKPRQWVELGFSEVSSFPIIYKDYCILSHQPIEFLSGTPYVNLFGHVHNSPNYPTYTNASVCVCMERWDYKPVLISKITERFR